MEKKLKAIPEFSSWEEEDQFWSIHSVTELDLEEDLTPFILEPKALQAVRVLEVPNPAKMRSWKRKAA
jgi:hypothetical protein